MEFQDIGDTERVLEGVEFGGLLGFVRPGFEGLACFVGIGEDHDLVVYQRGEELGFEHLEASAGEPNEVGEQLGENDGGLF